MTYFSISNLTFTHPNHAAPQFRFEMKLAAGKILAIGGQSGCGKSTLLDLISGFLQPHRGEIMLDGANITNRLPAERQISSMFQNNNLFEHLSVMENITLGLNPNTRPSSAEKSLVSEKLDQVGLSGMENRQASTLSGGQMQRVALVRELLRDSRLILLDEPFNGLDDETRNIMLPLLKAVIAERNCSIILVTHDRESMADFADSYARIEKGQVVEARARP